MHESEGEMTSTRNGQWRMERNSGATAELKMVRLDDYMYKGLMYMFIQGWGRERKEMPIFLVGATRWPGMPFTGIRNTGRADLGLQMRGPVWDTLTLRCCRNPNWNVLKVAASTGLELGRKVGMEKYEQGSHLYFDKWSYRNRQDCPGRGNRKKEKRKRALRISNIHGAGRRQIQQRRLWGGQKDWMNAKKVGIMKAKEVEIQQGGKGQRSI